MSDHLTEEEQIEAFKRWWDENKSWLIALVLVACASYVGMNFWKADQAGKRESASNQYELLTAAIELAPGAELSDKKKSEARALAGDIVEAYPGSAYADFSNMILARFAVEDKKLEEAASLLEKVIANKTSEASVLLAKSRLARVKSSLGKYDDALALVPVISNEAYKAMFAEIRGDIYIAKGLIDEANTAYNEAMENLALEQYTRRNTLQQKLDYTKPVKVASEEETSTDVPKESDDVAGARTQEKGAEEKVASQEGSQEESQ